MPFGYDGGARGEGCVGFGVGLSDSMLLNALFYWRQKKKCPAIRPGLFYSLHCASRYNARR